MKISQKTCLVIVFTVATLSLQAQIHFFEGTFSEAVKKAKTEKKHIFLDAYASWCGPCKAMERDVFTDASVAEFFNANFISLHIDMEKGEGPVLAKKLPSIDGYPSLLFFNEDGHLGKTILGSRSANVFLQEAKLMVNEK